MHSFGTFCQFLTKKMGQNFGFAHFKSFAFLRFSQTKHIWFLKQPKNSQELQKFKLFLKCNKCEKNIRKK